MAARGGRRAGAGRKPGIPNKVTADIKAVAQGYGPAAIAELARLAGLTEAPGAESETARIVALRELLDRGYGKPTQPLESDADMPTAIHFTWAPAVAPSFEPPIEAVPAADADVDTEVSQYVVRFAGDC